MKSEVTIEFTNGDIVLLHAMETLSLGLLLLVFKVCHLRGGNLVLEVLIDHLVPSLLTV